MTFIKNGEIVFTDEKDSVLESWGVIKGGNELLVEDHGQLFRGIRKHEYGFEALTSDAREVARRFKGNVTIEKPTLEDIMVFMTSNNGGNNV